MSAPTHQNLNNLYRGPKVNYLIHPDGLNNTFFSQGYVLETALAMGTAGGPYIPRTGEE